MDKKTIVVLDPGKTLRQLAANDGCCSAGPRPQPTDD